MGGPAGELGRLPRGAGYALFTAASTHPPASASGEAEMALILGRFEDALVRFNEDVCAECVQALVTFSDQPRRLVKRPFRQDEELCPESPRAFKRHLTVPGRHTHPRTGPRLSPEPP